MKVYHPYQESLMQWSLFEKSWDLKESRIPKRKKGNLEMLKRQDNENLVLRLVLCIHKVLLLVRDQLALQDCALSAQMYHVVAHPI